MHILNLINLTILKCFYISRFGVGSICVYVAFGVFIGRDDLDDEEEEDEDLTFFLFGFLGTFARSLGGRSIKLVDGWRMECSKSVEKD